MSKSKITLYFDVVSPFGYLAYHLLRNSPVFKPCEIDYVPVLLGAVMKATGGIVPLTVKNKDVWINTERRRWATLFNIPCADEAPEGFPVSTLAIQRALSNIAATSPQNLTAAIDACYKKFWAERNVEQINKPENLLKLLSSAIGEDTAKTCMERANTAEGKAELNSRTEKALSEGMFGVPFFVATNKEGKTESFWGFDHLGQVTYFLGLEKPRPTGGWQAML